MYRIICRSSHTFQCLPFSHGADLASHRLPLVVLWLAKVRVSTLHPPPRGNVQRIIRGYSSFGTGIYLQALSTISLSQAFLPSLINCSLVCVKRKVATTGKMQPISPFQAFAVRGCGNKYTLCTNAITSRETLAPVAMKNMSSPLLQLFWTSESGGTGFFALRK